jgi:hypothetical protein
MSPAVARRSALLLGLALTCVARAFADTSGAPACGPVAVTQNASLVPEALNSLACIDGPTGFHYENSWYRAFPSPGPEFEVCAIEISIEEAVSGDGGGQPLTVNVYANPDQPFPGNFGCLAGQLVGTATLDLPDQALTNLVVPVSATIPARAEMIVEIFVPDGLASQDVFFAGSNSQPQTGPTYVYSPLGCGDLAPVDLADIGFPDSHVIMSIQGTLDDREPTAIAITGAADGVIDPGEVVVVAPSWKNDSASAVELTGTASGFTGPAGLTYDLLDATADYGTIAADTTAGCAEATGDCYSVQIGGSTTGHRDATLDETTVALHTAVAEFQPRTRLLHVGGSFGDVPTSNLFYAFIENVLHNGVTGGCATPGFYCPGSTTLRQQMAVFLLKASLGPCYIPPPATGGFDDVPVSNSFAPWIEDLAGRGITTGCGPQLYCPFQPVTRKQMAVFLLKTLLGSSYLPPTPTGIFDDVPADSFRPWIEDLYNRAITGGCAGGPPPAPISYCPENPITRGQMAAFLVKTFGLVLYRP